MSALMRGNLRMAISGVRGAKWRSMLTMLGIIVGIVAVVTVVGIGKGVQQQVSQQLTVYGDDVVVVRPSAPAANKANPFASIGDTDVLFGMGATSGLSPADVQAVQQTQGVAEAAPLAVVPGSIQIDGKTQTPLVLATGAALPEILKQGVEQGDGWKATDQDKHIAVIGRDVAEWMFGEPAPLGRAFTFRGQQFVVRGVFERFNSAPFSPTAQFDRAIFIPSQAAAEVTHSDPSAYVVLAKPVKRYDTASVSAAITDRLRQAHGGVQDFSVSNKDRSMAEGGALVHLMTMWICAVAVIALFIGGIGIMNIMLLTVTERMYEIGVRKAIGASSRQIWGQFMLEAVVLSVLGGVIGIAVSLVVIGLLYAYTDFKPIISWEAIVIATVVSLAVGIIFGTIPAVKAARKDPIEALRHE